MKSVIPIQQKYISWYKNGFERVPAQIQNETSTATNRTNADVNKFETIQNLTYPKSLVDHQGFYQCAIKLPDGRILLSERAKVRFSGEVNLDMKQIL